MNADQLKERLQKGVKLHQVFDLNGVCDRTYTIISTRTRDVSLLREGASAPVYLSYPKSKDIVPILQDGEEIGFIVMLRDGKGGTKGALKYHFVNETSTE